VEPAAAPSTEPLPPKPVNWSFDGPFGVYDRAALQRGFQVYKEVCSACHALTHIVPQSWRARRPGLSEDRVRARRRYRYRPVPTNRTHRQYIRPTADARRHLRRLRAAAVPQRTGDAAAPQRRASPDLSLIVRARAGHADYAIPFSPVLDSDLQPTSVWRGHGYLHFPGHQIAMPHL
jgi:ubiquinol-cytochrome c reductase cytochrome c1 subunit